MRQQNSDDISSEMIRIMGSDEHNKLFGSVKLNKIAQNSKPEKDIEEDTEKDKNKDNGAPPKATVAPVTAKSAIINLVKIADYLGSKGMIKEEALAGMLLESIALENRKTIRKQAEGMLSVIAEDIMGGSTSDEKEEDENEDVKGAIDEEDEGKTGSDDEDDDEDDEDVGNTGSYDESVKAFEKAMLEDENLAGESSVVPY